MIYKKKNKNLETKEKERKKIKPKKTAIKEYVLKKNGLMKILRVVLWTMISCIFIRGVISIVKPSSKEEVTQLIQSFERKNAFEGDVTNEIMGFAENFTKEYLTYSQSGESDFKIRIAPYVSDRIFNMPSIYTFRNEAKAMYTKAYRKEKYSESQYDVYVLAEVKYTIKESKKNGEESEIVIKNENSILKVPVYVSEKGYCIESIPVFVEDNRLYTDYQEKPFYGVEIKNPQIELAVKNFLTAYYTQEQSVIDYFLSQDADRTKFYGLNGRYEFQRIDSINIYQVEGISDIICILKIKILDSVNEEDIIQEFNLKVSTDEGRVYIKDLDTKIVNIDVNI